MKTMSPDGRIVGAQVTSRTAVRAAPAPIPERTEPPGDVTTIWRDGMVWRQSPGKRAKMLPSISPRAEN
jgi:hypothetical protein